MLQQGGWCQKEEAEVQKIIVVSDAVRGTKVDLDGKGFQEKQMEELPGKWKPPKGADWTEMRKEETWLKCTLLNGSAWSTEKKYMRRYRGKCDVFFGIEHRLIKEEWRNSSTKWPRKDGDLL